MDEENGKATPHLSYREALAEVERLRAREAALVEVVRAVAEADIEIATVGTVNKTRLRFLSFRQDVRKLAEQARALMTQIPNASEA